MPKEMTLADFVTKRGVLQELDPELAAKAIQGYRDAITPAARADEAFYRQFSCPECGGDMIKEYLGGPRARGVTWVEGSNTPQALLRCAACKLLMNPRSGMIVETGNHVPVIPVDDELTGIRR